MKLNFPLKTHDLKKWQTASESYTISQSKTGGWFPIARNAFFHGGIHLDGRHPVYAVADGEVIAYRISNAEVDRDKLLKYPVADKNLSIAKHPLSDNFVLTRHAFTPPDADPTVFYVLYMHLLPLDDVKQLKSKAVPIFLQSRFFVKKDLNRQDGLTIFNTFDFSETGTIPPGTEIFFEHPEQVAVNHRLKPVDPDEKFKRITHYNVDEKPVHQPGYVIAEEASIEVKQRIDYQLDKVVNATVPIRRGDVIGLAGPDGVLKDETTVHMEVFIKDKKSYSSLKTYTKKQKTALELNDDHLLNLQFYLDGSTIINSVTEGNTPKDKYCDIKMILQAAYPENSSTGIARVEELILKANHCASTIDRLRRLVVKAKSEWQTEPGEFDRLKTENGGIYPPEKFKALLELHQDKLDFWHQITDIKDAKEVYFFHPIKFIEHLKLISREDEIIFVPDCSKLGEEMFLVLKPHESDELRKEEQELTEKIEKLKSALEEGKEAGERAGSENEHACKIAERNVKEVAEKIKAAKEQVAQALTRHAERPRLDILTEIRRLSGKKTTYIRSDKIKNHWRSYALEADDNKKSLRTQNGRLNTQRLKEQFGRSSKKVQNKFNFFNESLAGHENAFGQYIDELNKSLEWSSHKDQSNPEQVNFDASAQAQLLRFYSGAALEGNMNFKEMQFGFGGNANAAISLAEGKLQSRAYWPHKGGFEMRFELNAKRFDFGKVRAYLEIKATAFVGASAIGSVCIEINKPKDQNKLVFRGVNKAGKGIQPDTNTASGKLFAGAEAGGEVVGKCEWDNPEKRSNPNSPAWCEFVAIGYGLKGAAGLGAEVEFKISYESRKFVFRARAGLVLGLGAGGMIVGSVDAGTIMEFVQFIYHQLKNHGYHFLDAIEEDAFNRITRLSVWAIETGEEIADFGRGVAEGISDTIEESVNTVAHKMAKIEAWWLVRQESKYHAQTLARNILAAPDKLKFTTPEAKGIMLHHLCQTFWEINEEPQEQAIIEILKHVQSTGEYQKVCEHLTPGGSKTEFLSGHKALIDILDGEEQYQFREMRRRWRNALINTWESGWKTAFNETTPKNSAVETVQLV